MPTENTTKKRAVIIGAGPAGLTAAFELLTRTDITPLVIEQSDYVGGLSRTVNYKGNRIDIGGHRFFSKSDRVMQWWLAILPTEKVDGGGVEITYQQQKQYVHAASPGIAPPDPEKVMLIRRRKSRIFFMRQFYAAVFRLPDHSEYGYAQKTGRAQKSADWLKLSLFLSLSDPR